MPALDFLFLGIALSLSAGLSPGPLLTDLPIIVAAIFFVNVFSLNFLFLAGGIYLIYLGIENLRMKSFKASVKFGISSAWFKGFTANITNLHPYMFWLSVGAPLLAQGIKEGALSPAAFLLGFYPCLVGSKAVLAVFVDRAKNLLETKRYFFFIKKYFLRGSA